jgi:hypothetical protein
MRIGGTLGPSTTSRASTTLTSEPSSVAGTSEGRLPCSNDVGSYVMGTPVRRSWSHADGAPPDPLLLDEVDDVDDVGAEPPPPPEAESPSRKAERAPHEAARAEDARRIRRVGVKRSIGRDHITFRARPALEVQILARGDIGADAAVVAARHACTFSR